FTQGFPVVVQWFSTELIHFFFVGIDWQDTLRVSGVGKGVTGTLFLGQFVGRFQQPVLHGLKGAVGQTVGAAIGIFHTVFGQVVGIVDDAHAKGTAAQAGFFRRRYRVILIAEQAVECTDDQF